MKSLRITLKNRGCKYGRRLQPLRLSTQENRRIADNYEQLIETTLEAAKC